MEGFNKYFSEVGASLSSQIPRFQTAFRQYLPESAKRSLKSILVSENEMNEVVINLKKSSSGHDIPGML